MDFQDDSHGGNLGFPIGIILAFFFFFFFFFFVLFYLKTIPILLIKFLMNLSLGSGEDIKTRFS